MSSLKYWIWLSSVSGIGPVTAAHLLGYFETPEQIFFADTAELKRLGVKPADCARLSKKDIDAANNTLSLCAEAGFQIITLQDAKYPERLKNIYGAPLVLYVLGKLPDIDEEPVIAVVGTRDCTPYGIKAAEGICYDLARHGFTVATGLAKGIDAAAARGALYAGGRVIGVTGSGLDIIYPAENKSLFKDVAGTGAIISEYPPGTPAIKSNFPARNRIISGISLGITVIEAPIRSGALITASRALEQGRDVFVIPGNVDARSCEGSNALLREGAIPVLSAKDIIDEYADLFPGIIDSGSLAQMQPTATKTIGQTRENALRSNIEAAANVKKEIDNITGVDYIDLNTIINALDGDEKTVAIAIGAKTIHVDEIIIDSGMSAQKVLTALTMLEIKGFITRDEIGKWKIRMEY